MLGNLNLSQKADKSLLKILRKSFSQAIAIAFSKDSSFRDYRRSKVFVDESEYETIKEIIKSHITNTLSNIEAAYLEARNSNEFKIKTQNDLEFNIEEALDYIFPELSTNFEDSLQIDNSPLWKLRLNPHELDKNSRSYFHISLDLPITRKELNRFISTFDPPPFVVWKVHLAEFESNSYWYDIISLSCIQTSKRHLACQDLTQIAHQMMLNSLRESNFQTENNLYLQISSCLNIFEIVLGTKLHSNQKISPKASSKYRPQFQLHNSVEIPLIIGESFVLEVEDSYKYNNDNNTNLFLEDKISWKNWEKIYGNVPYIFGFTAISSQNQIDFTFGILERDTKSFVELQSFNLLESNQVADFFTFSLQLLPLINEINEMVSNSRAKS